MSSDYTPGYTPLASADLDSTVLPTEYSDTTKYEGAVTEPAEDAADGSAPPRAEVAKDQASEVGQSAVQAGQHVGGVAKDQAANVTAEAGRQAKDLISQAQSELAAQAGQQQTRLAQGLRSLGEELHSMAGHSEQAGAVTDLAKQAAGKSHELASWLDDREPGQLVDEVKAFARRQPGTFLLLAAGAGLLGGRLTRGLKEANTGDES